MIDVTAPPRGDRLPSVAYAPGWAPATVTARGVAACHLSRFQDVWAGLSPADRAYFAETLAELLVDAASAEMAPR